MIKLRSLKEIRRYGCRSGLIPQRQKGTSLSAHYLVSHSTHTTGQTRYSIIKSKCVSLNRRTYASPSPVHVDERDNRIVNRLNKTKIERNVDHEEERIDRIKQENAVKRAAAAEKVFNSENSFGHSLEFSNVSCNRESTMRNWRKGEKKKRLLDHTILCLMWRKTKVYQKRRAENWKRISCRYQVRRICIVISVHDVWNFRDR